MTVKRTEKSELETSKNGNRIPVIIDGVSYESIAEASRRLGVTRATIETYLRNGKKKPLSGMQKVVIAVVVTIFLAILIIFLIVASYARKTDEISSVKSKVSQISQKKSEDKAHYFDVPKQVSGMTFKEFRDYLTAQDIDLTAISWHIMPEKYTSAGDYQATLKGLATDDNYSLNDLDGDWTNKKTGKNYDMHTIVAVYQLNNDVRDNRVGMNHVEWQQHKIEVWISEKTTEEQQKTNQSASESTQTNEILGTNDNTTSYGKFEGDYYIQEGAWQAKNNPEETKAKGPFAYNFAAYHKTTAYLEKFGTELLSEKASKYKLDGLYLPEIIASGNYQEINQGFIFLTSEYSVIIFTVHVADKGTGIFQISLETRSLEDNKLLNKAYFGYLNSPEARKSEFYRLTDKERWQYVYDNYSDFKYVSRIPDTLHGPKDGIISAGEQQSSRIEQHQEFSNAMYETFNDISGNQMKKLN
ncbi:hypothetical protein FACS1894192_06110 [Bacilli bacterium]|nr:hypothetical protein FACS1894192_06110 [Bacilli bacterium]GHU46071.1 hypothetical protein FACS1894194_3120 [Bacilli bacterium]